MTSLIRGHLPTLWCRNKSSSFKFICEAVKFIDGTTIPIIFNVYSQQNAAEYRGKKAAIAAALQQDSIDENDTNLEENEVQHDVSEDGLFLSPYSRSKLKKWRPAPYVRPQGDGPGELGMILLLFT